MPELCPFCSKPIVREYGSFRCKNCARSSEDVIDLERKSRVAEVRKAARARAKTVVSPSSKMQAVVLAVARHAARKRSTGADSGPEAAEGARPATGRRKGFRSA
jgi:hypothetical protein